MKALLLLLLPTSMLGLFAVDQVTPEPYAAWLQGSAAAVVCGLLVFITTRLIPQLLQDNRAALAAEAAANREALALQQKGFKDTLDAMGARHERIEKSRDDRDSQLNSTLQELIQNCARHHGIDQ